MDKTALRTAAEKYGTPLYLFDLDAFTARAQRVRAAFGSDVHLCYSMKANPFVLRGLPDVFRWVEVCSPGELTICEKLGIPPERILYSGVNKGADDVARAVALGADLLTAESTLHFELICAAAAAQAGIENVAADLLVRHLEQRLFKRAVTALGDVLLDVLGVRRAAISQHHAVLLFIKRDLLLLRIRHAVQMINKAVDDLAAEDGLFQNFVAVLGLDVNVHHTQRLDVHERAHLAEAVAAAHLDVQALLLVRVVLQPHIDLQPARFTLGLEIVVNLHCAAGNAAGARADENGRHLAALRKIMLRLRAQGAEFFSIQLVHACTPSFLRMESSSSIACSGSILACTSPSTVITGANPQAPRHATVSSVKRPSSEVFFFPCSPRYS